MGPVGQSQARRYVSKNVRQVVIPVGRQAATVFSRVHQNVAPGGQSLLSFVVQVVVDQIHNKSKM